MCAAWAGSGHVYRPFLAVGAGFVLPFRAMGAGFSAVSRRMGIVRGRFRGWLAPWRAS